MDEITELNRIGKEIAGVENAAMDIGQAFRVAIKVMKQKGYVFDIALSVTRESVYTSFDYGRLPGDCKDGLTIEFIALAIMRAVKEAVKAGEEEP